MKFREFKKEKKSIVLVSHSMDLVKEFCEKTLYLQSGEMGAFASSEHAINQYREDMRASMAQ